MIFRFHRIILSQLYFKFSIVSITASLIASLHELLSLFCESVRFEFDPFIRFELNLSVFNDDIITFRANRVASRIDAATF